MPSSPPVRQSIPTAHGPAAVRVFSGSAPDEDAVRAPGSAPGSATARGTVLVGHGAGGQRDAADVLALTALVEDGWTVVLVDQPWRVAGRKVASPPPTLDRGWLDVLAALAAPDRAPDATPLPRPWVYAGRSAGARVACRTSVTAAEGLQDRAAAAAVVCLAFPLHPPGRPERSRVAELAAPLRAGVPTLVVQGARDPMGTPQEIREAAAAELGQHPPGLTLHEVPGNHSPTRDLTALTRHVRAFLHHLRPTT